MRLNLKRVIGAVALALGALALFGFNQAPQAETPQFACSTDLDELQALTRLRLLAVNVDELAAWRSSNTLAARYDGIAEYEYDEKHKSKAYCYYYPGMARPHGASSTIHQRRRIASPQSLQEIGQWKSNRQKLTR